MLIEVQGRPSTSENEGSQNICLLYQGKYLTGTNLHVINIKL